MLKNVKCARCVKCGKEYEAVPNLTNCECGGILDIIYDYDYIKTDLTKEKLKSRPNAPCGATASCCPWRRPRPTRPCAWAGRPLYEEPTVLRSSSASRSCGSRTTARTPPRPSRTAPPPWRSPRRRRRARRSSPARPRATLPRRWRATPPPPGLKTFIFVPSRAPKGKVAQLMTFGANVISVQGNYEETFELSKKAIDKWGWYNRNAAINPYLSEGKKTVALEIAEQLGWKMPDYLAISVGDGCTIAGVWKGLKDLYAIGFIDKLPRLISAQAEGCYPINRAIAENKPWEPMEENTLADSIAVGVPRNADKALMAIRESNGIVVNVTDEEIMAAQKLLGTHLRRVRRARGRDRHGGCEEALRAGRPRRERHGRLRRHRQRPQGRCQRHQVLRRADEPAERP